MDDRSFLHDGETLLVNLRPANSVYVLEIAIGIIEATVFGAVVVGALWSFAWQSLSLSASIMSLLYIVSGVRSYKHLKHSSFRVTTERILILHHHSIFKEPLKTIRWDQYQESLVGRRNILDIFVGARPITIRYGNPDSKDFAHFPSVYYAEDLKHYLDKAYSLVRTGKKDELKPFILKPRGQRSELITSN